MATDAKYKKAHGIRAALKAQQRVSASDIAWLAEYEKENPKRVPTGNAGRSAKKTKRTSYTHEETEAAAEGVGDAAAVAAQAMVVEAQGRRVDNLGKIEMSSLVEAVSCYKSVTETLLRERLEDKRQLRAMMKAQVELFESVRGHYLSRIETEAEMVMLRAIADAKASAGETESLEKQGINMLMRRIINGEPTNGDSGARKKRPSSGDGP